MLVDTTFRIGSQDYQLTEIHHLGGHIVRVDIRRDAYPQQSWAHAQILSTTKQWTTLVTAPVPDWYERSPGPWQLREVPPLLGRLATQLRERAQRILAVT